MCPTPIGRIHTRVATLIIPAIIGGILTAVTGTAGWIVIIGVFLLMGVALDAGVYSWLLKYQPPWMTGVLAVAEFGLLFALVRILEFDLTVAEAIIFYWVVWAIATATRIALLPIFSLTYLESAGEFRRIEWSIPEAQVPLPLVVSDEEVAARPGRLVSSASSAGRPIPRRPSPSGIRKLEDLSGDADGGAGAA